MLTNNNVLFYFGVRLPPSLLTLMYLGAGTFGAVRAGIYRPRAGGPEVKCAVKCLKQSSEDPVPKVYRASMYMYMYMVVCAIYRV